MSFCTIGLMAGCSTPNSARTISGLPEDEVWRSGGGSLDSPAAAERRGCCTNHGGASGCNAGKVQCSDGSSSSNCDCD